MGQALVNTVMVKEGHLYIHLCENLKSSGLHKTLRVSSSSEQQLLSEEILCFVKVVI